MMKYEWKNGYIQNRMKLLLGTGVLIFITYIAIEDCLLTMEGKVTLGDCLFYLFAGSREYRYSQEGRFELPVLWLLFHAYLFFMLCSYPANDMKGMGIQGMLRTGGRRKWFLGKFLWAAGGVGLFWVLEVLVLVIEIAGFRFTRETAVVLDPRAAVLGEHWGILFFLPLAVNIAIAVLQLIGSLFFNPFLAYTGTLVYLIISVYLKNMFLLGNYSMMLRNRCLADGGVQTGVGIAVSGAVILGGYWCGSVYMDRKDLTGKGQEL